MEDIPEKRILLVDKPKGISSFDVIRMLRKKLGVRKMGHSGTLDPNASGLLLVGVGEGTKKLKDLIGLPKTYEAVIEFGKRTDSGDITGTIVETKDVGDFGQKEIENTLSLMEGDLTLPAPLYSALKKEGKPLYSYARKGIPVEVPLKKMGVREAKLLSYIKPSATIFFSVKSGTYIRSLAEEIGKRLGTVATLSDLRRTSIGTYHIKDALSLDSI